MNSHLRSFTFFKVRPKSYIQILNHTSAPVFIHIVPEKVCFGRPKVNTIQAFTPDGMNAQILMLSTEISH